MIRTILLTLSFVLFAIATYATPAPDLGAKLARAGLAAGALAILLAGL